MPWDYPGRQLQPSGEIFSPEAGPLTRRQSGPTRKVVSVSYADPQSVTINAVATSLPRTSSGKDTGGFASSDGTVTMSVSHSYGKKTRRVIRLNQSKVSADVLIPSQNVKSSMAVYMVVESPVNGFTNTEIKYLVDALTGYLAASSGAKVTQLLGGEN